MLQAGALMQACHDAPPITLGSACIVSWKKRAYSARRSVTGRYT
jgi:hypothetical protein